MIVLKCAGWNGRANHHPAMGSPVGLFLKSYDPEAHDGLGFAEWTDDLAQAMTFSSTGTAWMTWRAVPFRRPKREDGAPNRPLTAFSVEIVVTE